MARQRIDPIPGLREAFLAMAAEWRAAGQDRFGAACDDFGAYVASRLDRSQDRDLPPDRVPDNTYRLLDGERRFVGTSRLRHRLLPHLELEGGHIGYDIRPPERRKGYGTALLLLTLEKARERGLEEVLVTCDTDNLPSARILETCGGQFLGRGLSEASGKAVSRYRIVPGNVAGRPGPGTRS